jgi:sugar lactone lactonase YvrE
MKKTIENRMEKKLIVLLVFVVVVAAGAFEVLTVESAGSSIISKNSLTHNNTNMMFYENMINHASLLTYIGWSTPPTIALSYASASASKSASASARVRVNANESETASICTAINTTSSTNMFVAANTYTSTSKSKLVAVLSTASETKVQTLAGTGDTGSSDGDVSKGSFNTPYGLALDKDGSIIVVDSGNNKIRRIKNNMLSTIAGASGKLDEYGCSVGGYQDGLVSVARFNKPRYAVVDSKRTIYISDTGNNVIRKIQNGRVFTFAGNGKKGFKNGSYSQAMFNCPSGLAIDSKDNIYVADSLNNVIRKITPTGNVTTYAGAYSINGAYKDGSLSESRFNEPSDISFDKSGKLFVIDSGSQTIRKIENDLVSTLCGFSNKLISSTTYNVAGYQDGYSLDARFNFPKGMSIADNGIIFIADTWNNRIRAIKPNGSVITIAGSGTVGNLAALPKDSMFNEPVDVLYASGKLYISDMLNNSLKVVPINIKSLKQIGTYVTPTIKITFYPKASRVQIWLNGKFMNLSKTQYILSGNQLLVSLIDIGKAWGAKVIWNKKTKKLQISKGKTVSEFSSSKDPLLLKNGLPMLDIRIFGRKIGMNTTWVTKYNAVVLSPIQN